MMQLQSGQAEVVVACGTENMTQLPYYLRKARDGYRMGHGELEDGLISILTAGRPLSQRHHRGKRRATLRYYPRSDGRFRPVEPAEGAEGDRGGSLSRADPALEVPDGKKRPACLRPMNTARHRVKSSPRCVRRLKPTAW